MKKILFVFFSCQPGGVYASLVNLLNCIKDKYEIDLLLFNDDGDLSQIPPQVNLIKTNNWMRMLGEDCNKTLNRNKIQGYIHIALNAFSKLFGATIPHKIINLSLPLKKTYDLAVSFTHDANANSFMIGCNDYVRWNVRAKYKMSFVHCDYLRYGGNEKNNNKRYKDFDFIACVSDSAKNAFLQACPEYKKNAIVVRNCLNVERIFELSKMNTVEYDECINILTVSRLSLEKGVLRAAESMKWLKENSKIRFKWHVVGDGSFYDELSNYVKNNNLEDTIILHGKFDNPYGFYPNASVFFLPSLHECAPMVLFEAISFGLPILTTETLSAKEMLQNVPNSYVCENSAEGIRKALLSIADGNVPIEKYDIKYDFENGAKEFERIVSSIFSK